MTTEQRLNFHFSFFIGVILHQDSGQNLLTILVTTGCHQFLLGEGAIEFQTKANGKTYFTMEKCHISHQIKVTCSLIISSGQ